MPSSNSPSVGTINEDEWQEVKGHYRLVVMGAAEVGKTAIVHQFLYDHFPHEYHPTVEELHRGEYDIGSSGLVLDILDTSGSFQFPAMRKLAVSTGDAFILVYSIDNTESFDEVRRLRDMLVESKPRKVPIVVVGNKCDLDDTRVIKKEVAETIISIDWENRFVESSAKDNINIIRIFQELLVQAKFPYDLNPAVQKRRTSLPSFHMKSFMYKDKQKLKRNSCAVS